MSTPPKPIRVLIVEDREDDAELVVLELRRGGYEPTSLRVETAEAMAAALEQRWDIIISDWAMPRFSALAAFDVVRKRELDLPFIIVSGTVGEETAVAAMKIGVHDFMTKGRFPRLIPAIERELREVENRRQSAKMREQLMISERMASVGTLAAGVAHEINNPLAAVIGNVEIAEAALGRMLRDIHPRGIGKRNGDGGEPPLPPDFLDTLRRDLAEAQDSIRTIQEAAERMRLVARDLRVFSHPGDDGAQHRVDVRGVLESSLRMASTEIRHRAQLIRNFDEVAPVEVSESRLGQVFLNLIVNAAQAIPEGKSAANQITIGLRMSAEGQVLVEIADTGAGIPPDVLPRIFNPFFTTKPSGIGTGLGLAICHRLVSAMGGDITVESEVGKGSLFRIALPPAAPQTGAEQPAAAALARPVPRRRILLVDDEPALRRTVTMMLRQEHDVIAIGTAKEAGELILGGTHFDLIICDLMMPEMTGMDLHGELERAEPDQARRMSFMTGGAFTEGAREFLERVPNAVLEKPFTSARLRQFVQEQTS
jgi:signal transduction histidine kinase